MKLLHTSDWHLGRTLYGKKRYGEFESFLDWLLVAVEQHQVDTLIIAGDVFDTSLPSNRAQALYYNFLCQMAQSCCRHVVIIAGNHDSPSFLDAPYQLLSQMNVHVVGTMRDRPQDEVLILRHGEKVEGIICAVPYLRDRDLRSLQAGESSGEKNQQLLAGLVTHYQTVFSHAEQQRQQLMDQGHGWFPIVGMGHLFTAGGTTLDGDGVRELYVGSLAHIGHDQFPSGLDYLALGHLHVPQKVGGMEHIRYCGSPLAMGFGEANQQKQVILIDFGQPQAQITTLAIPCFQPLAAIRGDLDAIVQQLQQRCQQNSNAWLEIECTEYQPASKIRHHVDQALAHSHMQLLRLKSRALPELALQAVQSNEQLHDLDAYQVFERCLEAHEIPQDQQIQLTSLYRHVVQDLQEEDRHAE